ncbi:MAG: S9 family peptidase [Pyrinomonadaceae bacterium]|nr:S9 family peptidase [Pyrinomonadaceae bacterium]
MNRLLPVLGSVERMLPKYSILTTVAVLSLSFAFAVKAAPVTDPLIPRHILFADEDKVNVRLSPDGQNISYLAPVDGTQGVWICSVADPAKPRLLFKQTEAPVLNLQWAFTSRQLVYLKPVDRDLHLFVFNLADGQARDLTPRTGVSARIVKLSSEHPEEILIGLNERDPKRYDLHRLNLSTGELKLVLQNDGYDRFLSDDEFRPRVAVRQTEDQGYELFRLNEGGACELLEKFTYEEARLSQPSVLDKAGSTLYLIDNRRTDTGVLRAIDLNTGRGRTIATDPLADIRIGLLLQPGTGRVQSASAVYGRVRRQFFEPSIKRDFQYLTTVHTGDVGIAGRSLDDRAWLVVFQDGGPLRFYIYDRRARKTRFLFSEQSELEPFALARRQGVVVTTRDGLKLPGDLYLPSWTRAGNGRYLDRPLPMLVYVHGGPTIAFDWNNWLVNRNLQLLANRGYVVFRIEFRGVEGFGKRIREAGAREWGRKMNDDLVDAVDWAVKQGLTERRRVGIWGWSYGGYATLAALTFTPDVFACGMAMYQPTDLQTMMETRGAGGFRNLWRRLVGDETTEAGKALLRAQSPLYFTERITKPLLITHGAQDTNVPRKYSDDFVAEMKKHEKPVTYLLYPDEGHDYERKENWISLFAIAERFFHEHLGGRYEPFGNDLIASSVQVLEGERLIPDLAAAIKTKGRSASLR